MQIVVKVFWMPKAGNSPDEYEDAFWPCESECEDAPSLCFAVADGATEASFSGIWAKLLVTAYARKEWDVASIDSGLLHLQDEWRHKVGTKPLPWYAEEKLKEGAFSTFLGVRFEETRAGQAINGEWAAFAVGDSCLFQVRGSKLLYAFPLDKASEFDSRPILLSSVAENNASLSSAIRQAKGTCEVGDTFYLMTDALSCWFLRRLESLSDDSPLDLFDLLGKVVDQVEFETRIDLERKEVVADGIPMMKNDDVTMIRCTVVSSDFGGEDAVADRR